jgi:hypothetical protein
MARAFIFRGLPALRASLLRAAARQDARGLCLRPGCGKRLPKNKGKFCTSFCYETVRKQRMDEKKADEVSRRAIRFCALEGCLNEITSASLLREYCSDPCLIEGGRLKRLAARIRPYRQCALCPNEITGMMANRKYCDDCREKTRSNRDKARRRPGYSTERYRRSQESPLEHRLFLNKVNEENRIKYACDPFYRSQKINSNTRRKHKISDILWASGQAGIDHRFSVRHCAEAECSNFFSIFGKRIKKFCTLECRAKARKKRLRVWQPAYRAIKRSGANTTRRKCAICDLPARGRSMTCSEEHQMERLRRRDRPLKRHSYRERMNAFDVFNQITSNEGETL